MKKTLTTTIANLEALASDKPYVEGSVLS